MKIFYIVIFTILLMTGCTSETDAENALSAMNFTDVKITGYNFFACSKDDFYHTGFKAKNAADKEIYGTVCSGLFFKNSTVRFR